LRVEPRGVTEVEVRAILERATGFEASVMAGRFAAYLHLSHPTGEKSARTVGDLRD